MAIQQVVGQVLAQLTIDPQCFQQGLKVAASSIGGLKNPLNDLSNGFSNLNAEMFRASMVLGGMSAAMIGINKVIGTVAYEYNKSMALIKAVTGSTEQQMNELSVIARDMGQQTTYGAREAAKGLLTLSRMGLSAAKSMQVLEPAMKLAQGQQEDMTMTTELLIQQLKAFGESEDQAGKYANVLAATSSKTAADLGKLNLSLSYVGPIGKMAGLSFEELNAALGMMYDRGIQASRAGTGLRFAIASLLGATTKTKDALAKLGLSLSDVNPQSKSFNEILVTLATRLEKTSNASKLLFDIFGKRAATAMAAVLNPMMDNIDAYQNLVDAVSDTDEVARQHETQLNSWSGQIGLIKTSIEELTLQLGDQLLPYLSVITGSVKSLVEWMKNLSPVTKEIIGVTGLWLTIMATLAAVTATVGFTVSTLIKFLKNMSALTTGTYSNMTGVVKAHKVAVQEHALAQAALTAALNNQIPALTRKALVEEGLMKSQAAGIVTMARKVALQEKDAVSQMRTYNAMIQKARVKRGMIALDNQLAISAAKAAIGQETFNLAMSKGVTVGSALTKMLVGVKAAMGGWVGILTTAAFIVIPMLIAKWTKWKALQEEEVSKTNDMIMNLRVLNNQLLKQEEIIGDINKKRASGKGEVGDEEKIQRALAKIHKLKLDIIKINPDLLEHYDLTNKKITISRDKLKELVALEITRLDVEKDISLLPLDEQLDKYKELRAESLKLLATRKAEYLLAADRLELVKKEAEIQVKRFEKGGDEAWQAGFGGVFSPLARAKRKLNKSDSEFNKAKEEYDKINVIMADLDEKIKNIETQLSKKPKKGGILDPELFDEFGESVGKTTLYFDSLLKKIREFDYYLDKVQEKSFNEVEMLNASEYRKNIQGIVNELDTVSNEIHHKMEEIQEALVINERKLKEAEAKGRPSDIDQYTKANEKLIDAKTKMYQVLNTLEENSIKVRMNLTDKMVEDAYEKDMEISNNTKKLELEKRAIFADTLHNRMKLNEMAKNDEIKKARESVLAIKREMADANQNKNSGVMSDVEYTEFMRTRTELLKGWEEYIKEVEKLFKEKGTKIFLDFYKENQQLQQREFKASSDNEVKYFKKRRDDAEDYYNKVSEKTNAWSKETREAYLDLLDAQEEYEQAISDSIGRMVGSFGDLFSAMAGSDSELANYFNDFSDSINDWIDTIQSAKSGNTLDTIVNMVKSGIDIIQDDIEEQEKLAEKNKDFVIKLNKSLFDLTQSSYDLNRAFLDFTRNMLSLNISQEEVENAIVKPKEMDISEFLSGLYGGEYNYAANNEDLYTSIQSIIKGMLSYLPSEAVDNDLLFELANSAKIVSGMNETLSEVDYDLSKLTSVSPTGGAPNVAARSQTGKLQNFVTSLGFELDSPEAKAFVKGLLEFNKLIAGNEPTSFIGDLSVQFANSVIGYRNALSSLETYNQSGFSTKPLAEAAASGGDVIGQLEDMISTIMDAEPGTVSVSAFTSVIDKLFNEMMKVAKTPDDVEKAYQRKSDLYNYMVDPSKSDFWKQLTTSDILDIEDFLNNYETEMKEDIEKILEESSKVAEESADKFKEAANDVAEAFREGIISYETSMGYLDKLNNSISTFPKEMQDELKKLIVNLKATLVKGEEARQEQIKSASGSFSGIYEDYQEKKAALKADTDDIINDWYGLIEERKNATDEFNEDVAKIKQESKQRIDSLKEERAEILGAFDFSETQNERSNRFAKAREVEEKIIDEIMKAEEELNSVTEKYNETINTISEKMDEWKSKYGSIESVAYSFFESATKLKDEFIAGINEQIAALEELGVSFPTDSFNIFAGSIGSVGTAVGGLETSLRNVINMLPSLEGTQDIIDENNQNAVNDIESAVNGATRYVSPTFEGATSELRTFAVPMTKTATISTPTLPNVGTELKDSLSGIGDAKSVSGLGDVATDINNWLVTAFNKGMEEIKTSADSMIPKSVVNIIYNDYIDLKGAYGITDSSVAEKIWRDIWAPARNKVAGRFVNTNGSNLK